LNHPVVLKNYLSLYTFRMLRVYSDKVPLGIAFLGGEGPSPALIWSLLGAADCPGDPLLAAADSGLLLAESAGLRPRWIIGDMDSLGTESERLASYPPEQVIRYPPDKDSTDTELAFSLLEEKGARRIWLAGGGGGRLDHLFAIRSLFERDRCPERWITREEDVRCLEGGSRFLPSELVFSGAAFLTGSPISVFPLGAGPWKALSRGLKWPLDKLPWDRGFFGLSNEAPEGFTIKALKGRFMVTLPVGMLSF
jgi:thiamine pyrophosphokinase